MNKADSLILLVNRSDGYMPIVAPAKGDDYIIGVTTKDVKKDYYTKLFTGVSQWGGEFVAKAAEDLPKNTPVTLQGYANDTLEYMYGTLWGYTIGPWSASLLTRGCSGDPERIEEVMRIYRWPPQAPDSKEPTSSVWNRESGRDEDRQPTRAETEDMCQRGIPRRGAFIAGKLQAVVNGGGPRADEAKKTIEMIKEDPDR